jgi:hypothetical protein
MMPQHCVTDLDVKVVLIPKDAPDKDVRIKRQIMDNFRDELRRAEETERTSQPEGNV